MMLADNTAMVRLMRSLGHVISTHRETGTAEMVVEIAPHRKATCLSAAHRR
jgi:hypothetical protein